MKYDITMCLEIAFSCLILPNIIIPKTLFQLNEKSMLCELKFADPHFNKSDRIDMIISAKQF